MNEHAPVCIAGMHRSGTSMLASLLHRCGLFLGRAEELIPPTRDNPEGHWEHQRIVALNDALFAELGGGWDCPPVLPENWASRPGLIALKADARESIARFIGNGMWGWKDPRASLTLGFWQELIPGLRVIICLRNPSEVAMSLRKRGLSSWQFGFSLWRRYNEQVLRDAPAKARLVTHYEAFFLRPEAELRRVLQFAGLDATDAVIEQCVATITSDLRHHRAGTAQTDMAPTPAEVQDLYLRMCGMAGWDPATKLPPLPPVPKPLLVEQEVESLRRKEWRIEMEQQQTAEQLAAAAARLQASESKLADSTRQRTQLAASLDAEIEATGHLRSICGQMQDVPAGAAALLAYDQMVGKIRLAVQSQVPRGAKILMVSKGDDRLLALEGRLACHFPSGPDGIYLGNHPADDAEAIEQLKRASEAGADYLVLPATALWWLDHYKGLHSWLSRTCAQVSDQPEICVIFALPQPFAPPLVKDSAQPTTASK